MILERLMIYLILHQMTNYLLTNLILQDQRQNQLMTKTMTRMVWMMMKEEEEEGGNLEEEVEGEEVLFDVDL